MKKILSFILVLVLALSAAYFPASAEGHTGCVIDCGDYVIKSTGEGECEIVEYKGKDSRIVIPDEIEGMSVNSIGDYAFAYSYELIGVKIPSTIKSIGEGAFFYCYNLTTVEIPDGVESIGEKAFGFNRRKFDLATLTYMYRADPTFTVYASENSVGAKFATANGYELNQDEMYNDFASYVDFSIPYQWTDFNDIYCHIWDLETGESFTEWQSEEEKCEIFYDHVSYNPDYVVSLNYDTYYGVVFSTDTGEETFPAIYIFSCGEHLYTTDTYLSTPDNPKARLKAIWHNGDDLSAYEEAFGIYDGAYECTPDEATPDETTPDEPALSWGDVNCDGAVNVRDATEIQKYLASLTTLSDTGLILGHFIDKDLELDIKHATGIQKYCASLRTYEKIGKPAVTYVGVERPYEWYRKEMKAISWNDTGKVSYLNDASENKTNTDHAEFLIPIYNPYIVLTCDGYETDTYTVDFYGNDQYGNSAIFCECFGRNDEGKMIFIWANFG